MRKTYSPSDAISCFENRHSDAVLDENVGTAQARKPRADNADVWRVGGHGGGLMVDVLSGGRQGII